MSSMFTFNDGIPAANNNPSADQPIMLQNNVATLGILAVDHVTFNLPLGGTHKQVTITSKNTPAAPTDPISVLYTANGTASTVAQAFFVNQNATFPVSSICAFGSFVSTAPAVVPTFLTQFNINVAGVARTGTGYTIPLVTNTTTGSGVCAIVTSTSPAFPPVYSFSAGVLTINSAAGFGSTTFNFIILQI